MNLVWCAIALALTGTDDPTPAKKPQNNFPTAVDSEKETWPLTLHDATQISLDNSEFVRVLRFGKEGIPVGNCFGPQVDEKEWLEKQRPRPSSANALSIVIEPVKADSSSLRFKSEVMALVRSVEQAYWTLAQAHSALWAADRAVSMAQDVVDQGQDTVMAYGCRADMLDLAEATERLEQFNRGLVDRTSDVVAAERALRKILGLPESDSRRIIPVTPQTQARLEPDWETCLDTLTHQLLRSRPHLKQVIHHTTHSLARGFLEVDAGFKFYATAERLRVAAERRLQEQRAYWEEDRITTDRFFDAVEQYATAVTAEHHYLAVYNSSIAFLSECQGTLLAEHNIIVAEPQRRDDGQSLAGRVRDDQAQQASFTPAAAQPRKPPFLELWQASTGPWLVPSLINVPDPMSIETESKPASPAISTTPKDATEVWPMSVQEAIAVALDSSEIVRVISLGDRGKSSVGCRAFDTGPEPPSRPPLPAGVPDLVKNDGQSFVIARLNADASSFRFQSEVMALVRSVEQAYWTLAQAHSALWAADRAVSMAQDVVDQGQDTVMAYGCRADMLDLAEATERLEQFNRGLVDRTSDVVAAERALRKILGLPESDSRRIIPVTPPIETPLVFAWGSCLDSMITKQHEPLGLKAFCRSPRKNVIEALRAFDETLPQPETRPDDELSVMSWALALVSTSRSYCGIWSCGTSWTLVQLQGLFRRATQQPPSPFAKAVFEADRNYQGYSKANRLRVAAEQRMAAQRLNWSMGRITADRYLDAVEQFVSLVASERRQSAAYNAAVSAVNECEGILLEEHNIIVAEPHRRDKGRQTGEVKSRRE